MNDPQVQQINSVQHQPNIKLLLQILSISVRQEAEREKCIKYCYILQCCNLCHKSEEINSKHFKNYFTDLIELVIGDDMRRFVYPVDLILQVEKDTTTLHNTH